jgi:hypothetical protein
MESRKFREKVKVEVERFEEKGDSEPLANRGSPAWATWAPG